MIHRLPMPSLFPYTTLFRSDPGSRRSAREADAAKVERDRRTSALGLGGAAAHAMSGRTPMREAPEELRSEEHTSELQSPCNLVCRLLLEKKKKHAQKQYQDA